MLALREIVKGAALDQLFELLYHVEMLGGGALGLLKLGEILDYALHVLD